MHRVKIHHLKSQFLLGLAAVVLFFQPLRAEESPVKDPWMKWDLATGDWFGNRPLLRDDGFDFTATYTSQVWGNTVGGLRTGATYFGLLQFGLAADLEKAIGWQGGSFNTTWIWISGTPPAPELVGSNFGLSNFEGPACFRALDLWLQQKLFSDQLTLRAGMFNVDSEFTVSDKAALFQYGGFGWPILYNGDMGGSPAYPYAAPGVYMAVEPGGGWKFQAAVMQGTVLPDSVNPTNFAWDFDRLNGYLLIGEAWYGWDDAKLPGTFKLGAMFDTGYSPYSDGTGSAWGDSFFYGIIDQWVYREPGSQPDSPQGLAAFVRSGFTGSPDQTPLSFIFNSGLTYTGLIPGRDSDAFGIALCWDTLTPGATGELSGPESGLEIVLEATYQAQITPWLSIQPDVQYVIQPGGNGAVPNAFVLGLACSIDF